MESGFIKDIVTPSMKVQLYVCMKIYSLHLQLIASQLASQNLYVIFSQPVTDILRHQSGVSVCIPCSYIYVLQNEGFYKGVSSELRGVCRIFVIGFPSVKIQLLTLMVLVQLYAEFVDMQLGIYVHHKQVCKALSACKAYLLQGVWRHAPKKIFKNYMSGERIW